MAPGTSLKAARPRRARGRRVGARGTGLRTHLAAGDRDGSWGAGAACAGVELSRGGGSLKGPQGTVRESAERPGSPGVGVDEARAGAAESLVSLPRGGDGRWDPGDPSLRAHPESLGLSASPRPSPRRYGSRRLSQALQEPQPVPGARVGEEKEEALYGCSEELLRV